MSKITLETCIDKGLSPWHVVQQFEGLKKITYLEEGSRWHIKPCSTYVVRRGCSFIAFTTPQAQIQSIKMVAAHTDSPALKVKPNPIVEKGGQKLLQVEPYGAPILSSWIGRDLTLAGIVMRGEKVEYINLPKALFIPHVAFHLDRTVNETGHQVQKHDHLFALIARNELFDLFEDRSITYQDLYVVSSESVVEFEKDGLIAGPRLDNLACLVPAWNAFITSKESEVNLKMCIAWNHEEIGSQTSEGALSPFLSDVIERIVGERQKFLELKPHMEIISCDVAHGYHPNYPEKYDMAHSSQLGSGVVIKTNPNMRYSQSPRLSSKFATVLKKSKIPSTTYSIRNDFQSGSTIGPLVSGQMGIATMDIGIPLVGMHSIRELVEGSDIQALERALSAFLK